MGLGGVVDRLQRVLVGPVRRLFGGRNQRNQSSSPFSSTSGVVLRDEAELAVRTSRQRPVLHHPQAVELRASLPLAPVTPVPIPIIFACLTKKTCKKQKQKKQQQRYNLLFLIILSIWILNLRVVEI
jgi:hypothetical protein